MSIIDHIFKEQNRQCREKAKARRATARSECEIRADLIALDARFKAENKPPIDTKDARRLITGTTDRVLRMRRRLIAQGLIRGELRQERQYVRQGEQPRNPPKPERKAKERTEHEELVFEHLARERRIRKWAAMWHEGQRAMEVASE